MRNNFSPVRCQKNESMMSRLHTHEVWISLWVTSCSATISTDELEWVVEIAKLRVKE